MEKKFSEKKNPEIWVLPDWAATTIAETIAMDTQSSFFEPKLRDEIEKAQNEMKWISHHKVSSLLNTIKQETRPIEGHTDPGAIEDCWKELMEVLEVSLRLTKLQDGEQMNDEEQECHECGREWTRSDGRGCPYGDPNCFLCEKHDHSDCDE